MKVAHVADAVPNSAGGVGGGSLHTADNRPASTYGGTLLRGKEGAPDNYRLHFSPGGREGSSEETRHRHNFDQFRRALDGEYVISENRVIPAGWVGYFPESTFYGPKSRSTMVTTINIQFGGPTGNGYTSVRQRQAAYAEMTASGGTFDTGVYSWHDEEGKLHRQDAYEAVWEKIHGKKVYYAPPRYEGFIIMDPSAFPWVKDEDQPGVAHKWLGIFSEREIRVGFIHVDAKSSFQFGTRNSGEVMFLESGHAWNGDDVYETFTGFGTTATDPPTSLTAVEDCDFYYIKLPTF